MKTYTKEELDVILKNHYLWLQEDEANAPEETADAVSKPTHYNHGEIECIDYLKDNMPYEAFLGYLEGNLKKYLHRFRHKGKPVEDLKKAQWYLNYLLSELSAE